MTLRTCLPLAASALLFVHGAACAQQDAAADEARRLRQIEAQMESNARAAEELRARQAAAAEAAEVLRSRLIDIADSLQDAEARASAIEATLARLEVEEAEAEAVLETRRRSVSDVLAALQSLERSRPPALAVSPDDATQAAVAAIALAAITPELQGQVEALKAQLAQIEALRAQQAQEQAALGRTEAALAERQRLLAEALAERESREANDRARLRQLAAEDAALAREATNLRDLIERLNARNALPEPLIPGASAATFGGGPEIYARLPRQFSAARSVLPWPAAGRLVTGFGVRLGSGDRSEDVTLSTRAGAVVTAPFGGEVAFADEFGRLGNVVILNVGEAYSLVLIGIGRMDVRRGERVRAGEPLGQMSRTGSTRLRFQVRRQNVPVNPMDWLMPPATAAPAP